MKRETAIALFDRLVEEGIGCVITASDLPGYQSAEAWNVYPRTTNNVKLSKLIEIAEEFELELATSLVGGEGLIFITRMQALVG